MTNVYDVGDKVRISASFIVNDVMTDPCAPTIKIKDPSKNIVSASSAVEGWTRNDAGDYHYDVTLDESGIWFYRWSGSQDVVAAAEGHFSARKTEF